MDDSVIYARPGKLRGYQIAAVVVALAVPVAAVVGLVQLEGLQWAEVALVALAAASAVIALEWRIRRPRPELRLSTKGIEGAFGLIEWKHVAGVELDRALGLRSRGVVVRLRPGATRWEPTGEFEKVDDDLQRLSPDRLELRTRHLELTPEELLRAIERFRLYAAG